ncbi:MAG: hypothetical protein JKY96_02755 [Phycisphaerales bacterium]|nr:hypothetical protein [Phycisphaerales bacterium]
MPPENPDSHHTLGREDIDGIARQLVGELCCIRCGYDLRGLSIRVCCPECELPIRATILSVVDPHAEQITPLSFPRFTGIGMQMWSIGALVAVMMIWILRISELLRNLVVLQWKPWWIPWIGLVAIVCSALGAVGMLHPHRRVRRVDALRAAVGVAAYAPLFFIYSSLYRFDRASISPLLNPGDSSLDRSVYRLMMFICVAIILWGLRPNAVGLAIRSVVVRTGRIDRQSMYAVIVSFFVAAVGDVLNIIGMQLGGGIGDVLAAIQIVLISLGSVLLTLGIINIVMDTLRLYPVIVRPGVALSDVFETNTQKTDRLNRS